MLSRAAFLAFDLHDAIRKKRKYFEAPVLAWAPLAGRDLRYLKAALEFAAVRVP
jgi:hypothetical protein